jgi:putative component of toxin-antitoxin plasmid stabilization module
MIEIRQTDVFARWFLSLKDRTAQLRIQKRIDRLGVGLTASVNYVLITAPAIASTLSSKARKW